MHASRVRLLGLAVLATLGVAASESAARPPAAEAATLRRVLWSDTFSRYDYRRQTELRARCTASAATPGVDYTEVRISAGATLSAPSLFECLGISNVTITNPPTPMSGPTEPAHQIAPRPAFP